MNKMWARFKGLIQWPLYQVSKSCIRLVPKKKNLWVFGAWEGKAFADNGKYFYLYVLKNHPNVRAVWLARNPAVINEVKSLGGEAYDLNTWTARSLLAQAEKVIVTHSYLDLNGWWIGGSQYVQLYHASFPLKKMGYDDQLYAPKERWRYLYRKLMNPQAYEKPHVSFSSSPVMTQVLSTALNLEKEKIFETGYPRVDGLTDKIVTPMDQQKIEKVLNGQTYKNLIYWVPTFRNNPKFDFFDFGFDLKTVGDFLERTNSVLIFRFHPFELAKIVRTLKWKHPRIIFENHGLSDPYPLLQRADVLVTDFSSIFADELILDKPMIFATFDFNGYVSSERPLYWNYSEVTPGPRADDWSSLLRSLSDLLVDQKDTHVTERAKMKDHIFAGKWDGQNCKRIFDLLT